MRKTNQKHFMPSPSESHKRSGKKKSIKREENPVMRACEVQRILGIGKNTFYEWCKQNLIPHKRVGRLIFISRKQFYEWLENGEYPGGAS